MCAAVTSTALVIHVLLVSIAEMLFRAGDARSLHVLCQIIELTDERKGLYFWV